MYILTYVLAYRYSDVELTDGCWSPTRPAVYFVTKMNGCVDIWDIGFKQNNPALSIQVCVLCIRTYYVVRTYVHMYPNWWYYHLRSMRLTRVHSLCTGVQQ